MTAPRRARGGQAAVFVAMCLMALMLVVAFATNTGIAVNDRIRMQSTADLATYAVAYSEAASLNDIVEANEQIADIARDCRGTLSSTVWNTVPCAQCGSDPGAELVIAACRVELDLAVRQFMMKAEYGNSVEPALEAGRGTADANFEGTYDKTSFMEDIPGSPTYRGSYSTFWQTSYSAGINPTIADFEQVTDTAFNYEYLNYCNDRCVPSLTVKPDQTIPTWFVKRNRDPEVWVAGRVMGTPEKRFLDTDYRGGGKDRGYFGASSTGGDDLLVAYAVAKPYDGSVGPSEKSGYQLNGNWRTGPVYGRKGIDYPKLGMVGEYRARMAGIQDRLAGYVDAETLIAIDGAMIGKSWDTSRFEH